MNVEFRVYKLKEDSRHWKELKKYNDNNEFVVVGEEVMDGIIVLKALQIEDESLKLIFNGKIDEYTYMFEKEELVPTNTSNTFDIPKSRLSMDILEIVDKYNNEEILELEPNLLKELKQIKIQ